MCDKKPNTDALDAFKYAIGPRGAPPLAFPDFPRNVIKTKPTVEIFMRSTSDPLVEWVVAEINLNENYWEVDVPKRKTLIKRIKKWIK